MRVIRRLVSTVMTMVLIFALAPTIMGVLLVRPHLDGSDDPGLMYQIVGAINRVAVVQPSLRGIPIITIPMGDGVYAFARPRLIAINSLLTYDPAVIPKMVDTDIKAGFHPPLGKCTGPEMLAYHETAHVIHTARGRERITNDAIMWFRRAGAERESLSGYSFNIFGGFNTPEALAEAFAAVLCNGGNKAERELYQILVG
jgi:hypothetical protein